MKHILLNQTHDVTGFASKDDSRYVLQSVHYNKEKGYIEATNGMAAIRVPVIKDEDEAFPVVEGSQEAQDCIIPVDKFAKVMKTIPKSHMPILNNIVLSSTEKQKIVFTTNDLDQQNDTKVKEIEGNYPNVDICIPKETPTFEISLAAEVLKPLVEYALKNSNDKLYSGIKFSFTDNLSAVRAEVKTDSGPALIVLMPLRMS